jgi:hypothetical protein
VARRLAVDDRGVELVDDFGALDLGRGERLERRSVSP